MKYGDFFSFERKIEKEYHIEDVAASAFLEESARSGLGIEIFVKHYKEARDTFPDGLKTFFNEIPDHWDVSLIRMAIVGAYQESRSMKGGVD